MIALINKISEKSLYYFVIQQRRR